MTKHLPSRLRAVAAELTATVCAGDRNTEVPPAPNSGVPNQVHENDNEFTVWNTGTQGTPESTSSCEVNSLVTAGAAGNDEPVENSVPGVPRVPGAEKVNFDGDLATDPAADLVPVAGVAGVPKNFVSFGPYHSSSKGLFYISGEDEPPLYLSSAIAIVALTRNDANHAWGRLVEIEDQDGHVHQITIPNEMLAKSGGEAVRVLLMSRGATVSTKRTNTAHLNEYLATVRIGSRRRIVHTTGWHNNAYVLPDKVYSSADSSDLVFSNAQAETGAPFRVTYHQAGTLEAWNNEIGQLAIGNSRLLLVLAIAFAAPIIGRLDIAGGGFHFKGASSIGKTSLIRAASSVFSDEKFMQTWRATSAGLEGVAAAHNDSFLGLDEISQVAPDAASETAYMLANGLGRTRATKDGQAKEAARFRLLFASTGEELLADRIRDDRLGRRSAMAGQEIRMLDIPSDVKYGVFENLHGFASGAALADHLREASRKFHGTPFDALIKAIMSTSPEGINNLKTRVKNLASDLSKGLEGGQVLRAAERFAVACVAAQFAAEHGIVSWSSDEIVNAIRACFSAWLVERGGDGALERTKAIHSVQKFIHAHQASRFDWLGSPEVTEFEPDDAPRINNLAGYYFRSGNDVRYGFTKGGLEEALDGLNFKTAIANLAGAGFLDKDCEGKNSVSKSVRGSKMRLYMISDGILAYESGGPEDASG